MSTAVMPNARSDRGESGQTECLRRYLPCPTASSYLIRGCPAIWVRAYPLPQEAAMVIIIELGDGQVAGLPERSEPGILYRALLS